jgi:hypothetical protein
MRMKFEFEWERLDSDTFRARVIGGWILRYEESIVFIQDRDHQWSVLKKVENNPELVKAVNTL